VEPLSLTTGIIPHTRRRGGVRAAAD
jgi:hypothetical protein